MLYCIVLTGLLFVMQCKSFYRLGIVAWRISSLIVFFNLVSMILHYPYWENIHYLNMLLSAPCLLFPWLTEKTFCNHCHHKTYLRFLYSNHCPVCHHSVFSMK